MRVGLVGSVVEVLRAREVGGGGAEGLEESELVEGGECGESASGGQVCALEESLGDPGGVVGGVEAGIDLEGLVGAPAGEGLDGGGRAAGG